MAWETKLAELLKLESKSNYDCFEAMAESLMDEFSDQEQEDHCDQIGEAVEEWWNANEEDEE